MVLPTFLRKRFNHVKLGFFLHSPFPSSEIYKTLPIREELLRALLISDLIGFHTFDYARHFLSCCRRMLGLSYESKRGYIGLEYYRRTVSIKILPVGIHMSQIQSVLSLPETETKVADLIKQFHDQGRIRLLGDDDMDIFKGISLKLLVKEQLLVQHPECQGKVAEAPAFKKAPDGAPANVAVGISRLGGSSAFIGKVGEDEFGYMLADILKDNKVDNSGMRFDLAARTALAIVTLRSDGEQEFMFFRNPSADVLQRKSELDLNLIKKAKILHYGSISLIEEPGRSTQLYAMEVAKKSGSILSYDPNLRLALWPSTDAAREGIMSIWDHVDVIKVSEDEISFLTGGDDPYDDNVVLKNLYHSNLKLLLVTEGSEGCRYYTKEFKGRVTVLKVKAVDTTGAGDAFVDGILKINQDMDSNEECSGAVVVGWEFRNYAVEERMDRIEIISVMARSSPFDKLLMVQTLKQKEHIVAVTGDVANDAPALNEANIGLSMGIAGTKVAKESSDIVILDDSFATVVDFDEEADVARKVLNTGAVENLLERSSFIQLLDGSVVELDQNARKAILQSLHEMSSSALRVLGFAYKDHLAEFATYTGDEDHPAHELLLNPSYYSSIESKLVFAGLAGLRDPPRKEVRQAIEDCKIAGIQVMVITGESTSNSLES